MSQTETFRQLSEQKSVALAVPLQEALAQTRASNTQTQARIAEMPALMEQAMHPTLKSLHQVEKTFQIQKKSTDKIRQDMTVLANRQTETHKQLKTLGSLIQNRTKEMQSAQRRLLIGQIAFGILQLGMLGLLIAFWIGAF
ncbi:hypothetical protein GCM10011498_08930 [Amylibacter cionae]|uniref:Uncharacterized protein n=1 Tax=Neptunicoccus cionae TaxID=2035344 RepID=A0A916VNB8_9RHOB|nr:hypothetical protein GCM10011498_08930 [Amylibacter cionae]